MPNRAVVLVNRNARGLRAADALKAELAHVSDAMWVETHTLRDLAAATSELPSAGIEWVIFAGGDGSVMAGLSAVVRAYEGAGRPLPRFAIVPAGTVSTIAKNLELPRRGVSHARRLVTGALAGRARTILHSTLRVRDASGGQRIGFIFGTGLVAQFFDLYDALPDPNAASAAKLVARLFVGAFAGSSMARRVLTPLPIRLDVEGESLPHTRYSLVVASTLKDVGLHLRPTFRAGEHPDRVHVVASTRDAMNLALQLPGVLAGTPLRGSGHVDQMAKSFRVQFASAQIRSYVLDGDRIDAGPHGGDAWVEVEAGPRIEIAVG